MSFIQYLSLLSCKSITNQILLFTLNYLLSVTLQ